MGLLVGKHRSDGLLCKDIGLEQSLRLEEFLSVRARKVVQFDWLRGWWVLVRT